MSPCLQGPGDIGGGHSDESHLLADIFLEPREDPATPGPNQPAIESTSLQAYRGYVNRHPPGIINIVHVDDEPDFAAMAAHFLGSVDDRFDVVPETNAGTGFERLREGDFDGVVSDYDMPD